MLSQKQIVIALTIMLLCFLSYSSFIYLDLPVKGNDRYMIALEGKKVWQQYNCNACHQLYGLGGYLGPDLTNLYSKRDTNYIKAFISSGTTVMPDFHLSEKEKNQLLVFFKSIDASGKSDPTSFTINRDGSIEQ
jgi:nitric oxide reductase subunit C